VETRWEGLNIINYQPCIYAVDAENIGLTGKGVIDGYGSNERWWYMKGNVHHGYHEGVDEWQNHSKIRDVVCRCHCYYVHEVQQALRQWYLKDMANNFKLK
jgi:polygalacturonase